MYPPFIPPIFVPMQHASYTAEGTAVKTVECEACNRPYDYELSREAVGSSSTFLTEDYDGAQKKAYKRLNKVLARACDPVPCPACGKFQARMVRLLKRHHMSYLRGDGLAALALGAGIWLSLLVFSAGWAWPVVVVPVSLGIILLLVRFFRVWSFDPNSARDEGLAQALADRLRRTGTAHVVDCRGPWVVTPAGEIYPRGVPDRSVFPNLAQGGKPGADLWPWIGPTAVFFLLLAALVGLPGFFLATKGFVFIASYLARAESGTAIVVRETPKEEWMQIGGVPVRMLPLEGLNLSPPLKLRFERLGVIHEQSLGSIYPETHHEGQAIPILFDPRKQEIRETSFWSELGLLAFLAVLMLVTLLFFGLGILAWGRLRCVVPL